MSADTPSPPGDHPDRNRRKLYGRRKGPKLSARQAGLRQTLLGELGWKPGGDPLAQFPNGVQEVWLEVGFGAGEHLVWQAKAHPHVGLIGAAPYEMAMAATSSRRCPTRAWAGSSCCFPTPGPRPGTTSAVSCRWRCWTSWRG